MTTQNLGIILIGVLVIYVAVSVTLLAIWSMRHYPKDNLLPDPARPDGMSEADLWALKERRGKILADLRAEWRTTVVALGTGIAVTPVFTLLGTLVGLVFGCQVQ